MEPGRSDDAGVQTGDGASNPLHVQGVGAGPEGRVSVRGGTPSGTLQQEHVLQREEIIFSVDGTIKSRMNQETKTQRDEMKLDCKPEPWEREALEAFPEKWKDVARWLLGQQLVRLEARFNQWIFRQVEIGNLRQDPCRILPLVHI